MSSELPPPARDEVVAVLGAALLGPGAVDHEFHSAAVFRDERDVAVVTFRWRRDPTRYLVDLPGSAVADGELVSPWTGLPLPDLEQWADDVRFSLQEEVQTGLVRRAQRTRRGDLVRLDTDLPAPDVVPPGYQFGRVEQSDRPGGPVSARAGGHLRDAGFDVRLPRRALTQGRLVSWAQVYVDNSWGEPVVGHAVVCSSVDPSPPRSGSVVLQVLQTATGTPAAVAACVAYAALRDAVEAGATRVTTELEHPVLPGLGFTRTSEGGFVLIAGELRQPPTVAAPPSG